MSWSGLSKTLPAAQPLSSAAARMGAQPIPGGGGGLPVTTFNPLTGASARNAIWDLTGSGWDQGVWGGQIPWFIARLNDSLELRAGQGSGTYTRSGTTTRVNDQGTTDTVAANTAPFDWIAGPAGISRYALRCDLSGAALSYPTDRNIRRTQGGISLWFRTVASGGGPFPTPLYDRVLWSCGDWKLSIPASTTTLRWQVTLQDGTTASADFGVSAWVVGEWRHVAADWSRVDGSVRIWTDGVLRTTTATAQRYAELADQCTVGHAATTSQQCDGYIVDARVWPVRFTTTLASAVFAVKA